MADIHVTFLPFDTAATNAVWLRQQPISTNAPVAGQGLLYDGTEYVPVALATLEELDTEAATRASAVAAVEAALNTEGNARASADTTLQNNINSEASARAAADATLQTNINTEASTRAAADTALQTAIGNEESARIAADALRAELTVVQPRGRLIGEYANLSAALTAFGADDSMLVLPPETTTGVPSNTTIPANVRLDPIGGLLRPAAGVAITIKSAFDGPPAHVFDLSLGGTVTPSKVKQFLPQWWGAKADGVTDDSAAIQAAINAAAAVRGTVFFPAGEYRASGLVTYGGIRLIGAGRGTGAAGGTRLRAYAGDLFLWSGEETTLAHMAVESMTGGGGHVFKQVGVTTRCEFHDLQVQQWNADKSVYSHIEDAGNYLFNSWHNCRVRHLTTATVPTFHFVAHTATGVANANWWREIEMLRTGNYGFWLESARINSYQYGNVLKDIVWEIPTGGCVKVLGGNHIWIRDHQIYDLEIAPATVNHLFYIGRGTAASNQPSRHIEITNVAHNGDPSVDLGASVQHVYIESAGVSGMVIRAVETHTSGNIKVDYNNNVVTERDCPRMTRLNGAFAYASTTGMAVNTGAAGNVGHIIDAVSGQTADLLQVRNSSQVARFRVGPNGLPIPPKVTSTVRDALTNLEDGMMIFNTTTSKAQVRAGGAWVDLH